MTGKKVCSLGLLLAYFSFLALFSTTFFVQELLNGSMASQLLILE